MAIARALRHGLVPGWLARRGFTAPVLAAIGEAVRGSEQAHRAELRFVVEGTLDALDVLRGLAPRARAAVLFSDLRVWDTAENSGVLIYVQCLERRIEIIADRGVAARVTQAAWDQICLRMQTAFAAGQYEAGALAGIADITALLARHFPADGDNPDELPDAPVVL